MWIVIFEIIAIIALIFCVGLFHLKSELSKTIPFLIAQAEKMDVSGAEKMKYVVDEIYRCLIPIAKAYFTKERIESIAQAIFDKIRLYADRYAKRIK